jgi:hypothetical protein
MVQEQPRRNFAHSPKDAKFRAKGGAGSANQWGKEKWTVKKERKRVTGLSKFCA